jgi:Ca2+-transporting ATPase
MADNALRVIGLAYKILPDGDDELSIDDVEDKLTFVGLVGMIDSPRPEVNEAIKIANKAGIKVVMATGDYKITAIAIARQVGIIDKVNNNSVLTGEDLDRMSDDELDAVIESVRVFARVSPEHKVKMARAFKRHGHIVAMTGDGVNDAPALKTADIGVAMGINGTDVTKEASDMVLEDDNFATIVKAIEGGRRIYDNITKYIRLMLSANFDEFLMIFVSISLGLPLPFLPIHILWVNLITDGLPAIALSVDPGEGDIMSRKPRDPKEGLLTRYWKFIGVAVALAFTSNFITYYYIYSSTGDESISRSAALTTIVFFELLLAYQVRSESKHVFQWGLKGLTENKLLSVSIGASLLLHLLILYIEPLRGLFKLASLSPTQLGVCIASSCLVFLIVPSWLIKKPQTQFDDEIQVNTKS